MRLLVVALATASLAACSSPTPPPAASTAVARERPSLAPAPTTTGIACDDPRISQQDYADRCPHPSVAPLIQVRRGESFQFLERPVNSAPEQWRIKVRKLTCWKSILSGVDLGDGRFGTAKPPKGKKFCVISSVHTNTGTNPGDPASFDALVTDKGQFAQVNGDDDISNAVSQQEPDAHYYETWTNPGDSKVMYQVWTIPAAAKPIAVLFPFTNIYSGPRYEVALPPAGRLLG